VTPLLYLANYHVTSTTSDQLIPTFGRHGEFHHHSGEFHRETTHGRQWRQLTVMMPTCVTRIHFVDYETWTHFDQWQHLHSAINRSAINRSASVACRCPCVVWSLWAFFAAAAAAAVRDAGLEMMSDDVMTERLLLMLQCMFIDNKTS